MCRLSIAVLMLVLFLAACGPKEPTAEEVVATRFAETAVAATNDAAFQQAVQATQAAMPTASSTPSWNSRTDDGAFIMGNPSAPVTLVLFTDFVCPHCVSYEHTIAEIVGQFVTTGQAKLEYRIFPTAGGEISHFAGQIAECADNAQPGLFWDVRDFLNVLAITGQYGRDLGERVAREFSLNYTDVLSCVEGAQQVNIDVALGRSLGITQAPSVRVRYNDGPMETIVLNGQSIENGGVSFEQMTEMVSQTTS